MSATMYGSARSRSLAASPAVLAANHLLSPAGRTDGSVFMVDGEPNFGPPASVIYATQRALADGHVRYDHLAGLPSLRDAIAAHLERRYGLVYGPNQILVSNGSSQAIFQVFQCFVDPGDRVLIPCPAWPTYAQGVLMAGGRPIEYSCKGGILDLGDVVSLIETKPKLMVVNSPHNPTGMVLKRGEIETIVAHCVENDVLVLSDAAYDDFVHPGVDCHDVGAVAGVHRDRVMTTRTFSKSYAMTGFRIGYLTGSSGNVALCAALQSHLSDNACTFAQYGALAAIEVPRSDLTLHAGWIEERLRIAYAALSEFLPCPWPDGGFYLFPNIEHLLHEGVPNCRSFVRELGAATGLHVASGSAFGAPGHIRLAVAPVDAIEIEDGMVRLRRFVEWVTARR